MVQLKMQKEHPHGTAQRHKKIQGSKGIATAGGAHVAVLQQTLFATRFDGGIYTLKVKIWSGGATICSRAIARPPSACPLSPKLISRITELVFIVLTYQFLTSRHDAGRTCRKGTGTSTSAVMVGKKKRGSQRASEVA